MAEIHDASAQEGNGALFGFLGVPAQVRRQMPQADLISHCRSQCVRLFGQRAAKPEAEFLKEWAGDPYTATAADDASDSHHAEWLPSTTSEQPWTDRLSGIESECAPTFTRYRAGTVGDAGRGRTRLND